MEGAESFIFKDVEAFMGQLKSYFIRSLFEWSRVLGPSESHSIVDFFESL